MKDHHCITDGTLQYGDMTHGFQSDHSTCSPHPSTSAAAAQPAPSDTIYMQVYQRFLNSLKDHLAKECCKLAHHATYQRLELSCCFAATSVCVYSDVCRGILRIHVTNDFFDGNNTSKMVFSDIHTECEREGKILPQARLIVP
jgi:hypothetical protein